MKTLTSITVICALLLLCAAPALAQTDEAPKEEGSKVGGPGGYSLFVVGSAFGSGLVILAAGYGISKIGSSAVESMARQPEVAGSIQTAMIISAALIEGATFFALIVCMLGGNPWN